MNRVDLHLHSTASDGRATPAVVVREVAARGLVGLSLTDHDTVDGLPEAAEEARKLGLDFLVGAELSANRPGRSVHLLAYGFDPADPGLERFFSDFHVDRHRRTEAIVARLNDLGVGLTVEDVLRESGRGVPTRAHVGRALVAGGWAPTANIAFARWIARDRPAFVEKRPSPPEEVIRLVHGAGGVVLLAHPGRDFTAADVANLVEAGLDGVEIRHPRNGTRERRMLERLAAEGDLLRGGGSDWHGADSGGSEPGSERVPASWMRAIRERCEGRPSGNRGTF